MIIGVTNSVDFPIELDLLKQNTHPTKVTMIIAVFFIFKDPNLISLSKQNTHPTFSL